MENIRMDLRLFDANTQVTTQQSLTEEMKTFYSDYLIDAAEPELVHDQFAQKHPIPANGGKTIQFRRFAPLGKALTALTEGVTPDGQSLSMTTVEAAVRQYGGYIQMSDLRFESESGNYVIVNKEEQELYEAVLEIVLEAESSGKFAQWLEEATELANSLNLSAD